MTNEIEMAGPVMFPAVEAVMVKMPAPITTETPNTVRSHQFRSLRSRVSGSSVSAIDCSTDLVRHLLAIKGPPSAGTYLVLSPHGAERKPRRRHRGQHRGPVRGAGFVGFLRPGDGLRARRPARRSIQPIRGAPGQARTPAD